VRPRAPELPEQDEVTAEGLDALKVPAELVEHELAAKSPRRRVVEVVVSLVAVVAIFVFAIPAISDSGYGEIWDELTRLSAGQLVELLVVWLLVMLAYTGVLTAALPGLRHAQALVVNLAGSAVSNVVPFGGAVGVGATYAMTMSWGFGPSAITLAVLVTGVWNVFVKLGVPVLALVVLVLGGQAAAQLVPPAVLGVVALATGVAAMYLVLRSEHLAARIGEVVDRVGQALGRRLGRPRFDGRALIVGFRDHSIGLLRTRWAPLTFWMVVFNLGQFVLLLMCVRALGADTAQLGWMEVLAAFALANLLTTIAVTPSGVGFVEAGTTAALIAFGGPAAASAAAVFLFRGFTYLLEIPLGALAWGVWAARGSWRRPLPDRASRAGPG
jgi:uncharacterized membrane protein YbhN (UPF0104 family)